jgi:hypothetical protein
MMVRWQTQFSGCFQKKENYYEQSLPLCKNYQKEKIMKRFTILFTILGVLAFSAFFQAWAESRDAAKKASIAPVYDSTGTMLEAISAKSAEARISPVYDSTGAMLEAINPKVAKVSIPPVYDATGAMLEAINSNEAQSRIAPVYDATGAMLESINP